MNVASRGHRARRRSLRERAREDFARFRGFVIGGALGGFVILALVAWHDGASSLVAPGPLARPHREVACSSCHAPAVTEAPRDAPPVTARAVPAAQCGTCHGEQPSERLAHRALAAQNQLTCSDCHGIHRHDRGLAFEPDGRITWFENGAERLVHTGASGTRAYVPLLAANACARCHDPNAASDPAAHCFAPTPNGAVTLCFDEHRRPAHASRRQSAERDAHVETTRAIALSHAAHPAFASLLSTPLRAAGYVVPGLALATAFVLFTRRRKRAVTPTRRTLAMVPAAERRLPRIDASRCLGCHACVDVCPYDVLEIQRYVAVVVRPDDCCGAGPCLERCPNGSLTLSAVGQRGDAPELSLELEAKGRPRLFLAGDITGGTLIRNALRQGSAVAREVAGRVAKAPKSPRSPGVDLLIVGAGPAGLAAALTAKELGLSVELIEQAGLAESIQRFSRHKLVLDGETGSEEVLPLWIGDAAKEQLLQRWLRTVRTARLDVRERVRLVRLEDAPNGGFHAHAEAGDGQPLRFEARHVLLATGARGTPRPLPVPIPEAALDRVHYDLSDARTFAGRQVIVVGLGDVAMESALALAEQQDCEVTVLHRGAGFRRGKQRNIEALSRLSARGRVKLLFEANITRVNERTVGVELPSGLRTLSYDALFVHIGALPARGLLEASGICSLAAGSVPKSHGTRSS